MVWIDKSSMLRERTILITNMTAISPTGDRNIPRTNVHIPCNFDTETTCFCLHQLSLTVSSSGLGLASTPVTVRSPIVSDGRVLIVFYCPIVSFLLLICSEVAALSLFFV